MTDYLSRLASKSLNMAKTVRPRLSSFYEPWDRAEIAEPIQEYIESEAQSSNDAKIRVKMSSDSVRIDEPLKGSHQEPVAGENQIAEQQKKEAVLTERKQDKDRTESLTRPPHRESAEDLLNPPSRREGFKSRMQSLQENSPRVSTMQPHSGIEASDSFPAISLNKALSQPARSSSLTDRREKPLEGDIDRIRAEEGSKDEIRSGRSDAPGTSDQGLLWHSPPKPLLRSTMNKAAPSIIGALDVQSRMGAIIRPERFFPAADTSDSQPDIRVAIGRIEVKATTMPAPSIKSSAPKIMSLEEYLRRPRGA